MVKGTAVTTTTQTASAVAVAKKMGLKLGKRLILPLTSLTHIEGRAIACRFDSEIVTGAATTGKDKPMASAAVTDLATGEQIQLVIPTVLESNLARVVGGYVGKNFFIAQGDKVPGKKYFHFELFELEE